MFRSKTCKKNCLLSKTLGLYSLSPQRQGDRTPHRCRIQDLYLISSPPFWSCSSFYTPRTRSLYQLSRKQGRQRWIQWWVQCGVNYCLKQAVNWGPGAHLIFIGTLKSKLAINWQFLRWYCPNFFSIWRGYIMIYHVPGQCSVLHLSVWIEVR